MTVTSKEYAEALFELALEEGRISEFSESIRVLTNALEQNPEYLEFLYSPAIPLHERTDALKQAFGGAVEENVLSFACLLCEKGRIREIYDCKNAFDEFYLAGKNISKAGVVSAVELNADEKQKLREMLETKYGKRFEIEYSVDASLLGGVVIKTDGAVLDGSLKRRLKDAKGVMQG